MGQEMDIDVEQALRTDQDMSSTLEPLQYMILRVLSLHFEAVKADVADELESLVLLFLDTLCRTAHGLAHHARRQQCSAQDVMLAIEQLGVANCSDLRSEASTSERVSWDYATPKERRKEELIVLRDEGPDERMQLEPWMPPLPALHSYARTPVLPPTRQPTIPTAGRQKPSAAALAHLATIEGRRHTDAQVVESLRALKVRLGQGDAERETVDWEQSRESNAIKGRVAWFVT